MNSRVNRDAENVRIMSQELAEKDRAIVQMRSTMSLLNNHVNRLKEQVERLTEQLSELQNNHDSLMNNILSGAPECWDGDESSEWLAEEYVRSLDSGSTDLPGHRDGCKCWD